MVPFRSSVGNFNGGIMTLFDLMNADKDAKLKDLNLFFLLLEMYGTGKRINDNGDMIDIEELRNHTKIRATQIEAHLVSLSGMYPVPSFKVAGLKEKLEKAIQSIIEGFTAIKLHFSEPGKLMHAPISEIGVLIPFKCGHRAFPKERERERRAIDIILKENSFSSPIGCIIPNMSVNPVDARMSDRETPSRSD